MRPTLNNEREWAVKTAGQLKMLAGSCADPDITEEERSQYLREELQYAFEELEGLPDSERSLYVQQLRRCFPAWDSGGESSSGSSKAPPAARGSRPVPSRGSGAKESPHVLLENFLDACETIEDDEKRLLRRRLAERGFAAGERVETADGHLSDALLDLLIPPQSAKEDSQLQKMLEVLRKRIKVPAHQKIDLLRTVKLLSMLVTNYHKLDEAFWGTTWKQMVPKESAVAIKRLEFGEFEGFLRNYLTGSKDGSSKRTKDFLDLTRSSIEHFLEGTGEAGMDFADEFWNDLSPDQIGQAVLIEESADEAGKVLNFEVKCWEKYQTFIESKGSKLVRKRLYELIAEAVERRASS